MRKLFSVIALGMFAAIAANTASAQLVDSEASQFAMQAGVIAGSAQSCGQNISIFNARVIEAVNTLGKSASERQQAMMVYEKALTNAQYMQTRNHTLSCGQVITSYNTLPLLRSDYQTTVLPQLAKMTGNS